MYKYSKLSPKRMYISRCYGRPFTCIEFVKYIKVVLKKATLREKSVDITSIFLREDIVIVTVCQNRVDRAALVKRSSSKPAIFLLFLSRHP